MFPQATVDLLSLISITNHIIVINIILHHFHQQPVTIFLLNMQIAHLTQTNITNPIDTGLLLNLVIISILCHANRPRVKITTVVTLLFVHVQLMLFSHQSSLLILPIRTIHHLLLYVLYVMNPTTSLQLLRVSSFGVIV